MTDETDRRADGDLTRYLNALSRGSKQASETLMPHVHRELKDMARRYLGGERQDHTLQPTALVHEAFLRLFRPERETFADRVHFFALAARTMRRVLVDHARSNRRLKRGGDRMRVTLDTRAEPHGAGDVDLFELDDVLEELARLDERQARIVEMRFFGGLEVGEVAEVLGVSKSTVEREWRAARAWLGIRLAGWRD